MKNAIFLACLTVFLINNTYGVNMDLTFQNCTGHPIAIIYDQDTWKYSILDEKSYELVTKCKNRIPLGIGEKENLTIFVDSSLSGQSIEDEKLKMEINEHKSIDLKWGISGNTPFVPYVKNDDFEEAQVLKGKNGTYFVQIISN